MNETFNKWQASLTTDGDMIVVRSDDKDEFREMLEYAVKLRDWLGKQVGGKVAKPTSAKPKDKSEIPPEECSGHEYYTATVKKEGPNKGKQFTACRNCNFFAWKKEEPELGENAEPINPDEVPF